MRFPVAASLLAAVPFAVAQDDQFNHLEVRTGVNDVCGAQPIGAGPVPLVNTALGFVTFSTFTTLATLALAPSGYQRTFHIQVASTSGNGYQGLYTLQAYDQNACADLCNGTPHCQGFNLYYERDPTLNPAPACSNPTATTNIKCTLWALPPTVANATNSGQTRSAFQVVIAGSNGYAKTGSVPANTVDNGNNPYV